MCGINNNKGNELYDGTALWVEVGGRGVGQGGGGEGWLVLMCTE